MNGTNQTITSSQIDIFKDLPGILADYWWILISFIILGVFFITIVKFREKINNNTLRTLEFMKKSGKYIADLFIELNNSKEVLRYFVHNTKWKRRIIHEFNILYDNYYGRILQKATLEKGISFYLRPLCSISKVTKTIALHCKFLNKLNHKYSGFDQTMGESLSLFNVTKYAYVWNNERLSDYCRSINSRFILIKSSAGNGKTNLLCNIALLSINYKNPCVFINSRDVNTNIKEYFICKLDLPKLVASKLDIFLRIYNYVLCLTNKRMIVIIDAINENDLDDFNESIADFANMLNKYKRIKLLVSCRNEYFECRYKKLFENKIIDEPFIYEINPSRYNDRIISRLVHIYKLHFNYTGYISKVAFYKLSKSLLLMRMFFETYKNSNEQVINLNKYKIYKAYIEQVNHENTNINLFDLLDKIVEKMLSSKNFNEVQISDLGLSSSDVIALKKVADENIIFTRNIKQNEGTIAERTNEVIYFVFDELRDYSLARYLISKALGQGDTLFSALFQLINHLSSSTESPLEGILGFSYNFFKSGGYFKECKELLQKYCPRSTLIINRRFREDSGNVFWDYGISLIFDSEEDIRDFEKEYIFEKLLNEDNDIFNVIFIALTNLVYGTQPDFNLIIEFILQLQDVKEIKTVFDRLIKEGFDENSFEPKFVALLNRFIKANMDEANIHISLYLFMLIFYSFYKDNDYFENNLLDCKIIEEVEVSLNSLINSKELTLIIASGVSRIKSEKNRRKGNEY